MPILGKKESADAAKDWRRSIGSADPSVDHKYIMSSVFAVLWLFSEFDDKCFVAMTCGAGCTKIVMCNPDLKSAMRPGDHVFFPILFVLNCPSVLMLKTKSANYSF